MAKKHSLTRQSKQALEPDSDIAAILELSDRDFKTLMINMIRALMDKMDSMQEQMHNASRDVEILRQNPKEHV